MSCTIFTCHFRLCLTLWIGLDYFSVYVPMECCFSSGVLLAQSRVHECLCSRCCSICWLQPPYCQWFGWWANHLSTASWSGFPEDSHHGWHWYFHDFQFWRADEWTSRASSCSLQHTNPLYCYLAVLLHFQTACSTKYCSLTVLSG